MSYLDKVQVGSTTYDIQDSKATADIVDLKSAINTQNVAMVSNINVAEMWEAGGFNKSTGAEANNSARARTKVFIPTNSGILTFGTTRRVFILAYSPDGAYIGAYRNGTGFVTNGTETWVESPYNLGAIIYAYPTYRFRLEMVPTDSVNIDPSEYSGFTISNVIYTKIAEVETKVNNNQGETLLHFASENNSGATNINSKEMWEQGAIPTNNGNNASNASRVRTKWFLPTNSNQFSVTASNTYFYLLAYRVDGTYVGAYKSGGTFVTDGSESGLSTINIGDIQRANPTYRFRIVVFIPNGTITVSDTANFVLTNLFSGADMLSRVRVIQYNIGQFNWGVSGGLSQNVADKIANYKAFFGSKDADIMTLQEFPTYIDSTEAYNAKTVLFDPLMSSYSHLEKQTIIFSQNSFGASGFSYLHTSGDPGSWCVYGNTMINGKNVALVSAVLSVESDQAAKLRALTKLTEVVLANYTYAIVGMDTNALSQTEAEAMLSFMQGKGYVSANWDYYGYKDTYNLGSSMYHAVDNVFVKGGKVINIEVPNVYNDLSSDHFPVVVDIRM